jgi:uroporphyrin-III C-methyltransferase
LFRINKFECQDISRIFVIKTFLGKYFIVQGCNFFKPSSLFYQFCRFEPMNHLPKQPLVILAGAGPGDEELITIKLLKRLAIADVIITDRLVNPSIIENHARQNTLVVYAGKQGYNDASLTQQQVNELILEHALKGHTVLRLKGGDVAFFSNVLDELQTLVEHNIKFEIIPGITAAAGASAYAGMPLTARGFSQGVHFFTFNPNSTYTHHQWQSLAETDDTLVVYMAVKNLGRLAAILMQYSRPPDTPIAVIEQATTIYQQVHISTLHHCENDFGAKKFSSPAIVFIGGVVALHQQFNWFATAAEGSVFKELKK